MPGSATTAIPSVRPDGPTAAGQSVSRRWATPRSRSAALTSAGVGARSTWSLTPERAGAGTIQQRREVLGGLVGVLDEDGVSVPLATVTGHRLAAAASASLLLSRRPFSPPNW